MLSARSRVRSPSYESPFIAFESLPHRQFVTEPQRHDRAVYAVPYGRLTLPTILSKFTQSNEHCGYLGV